MEYRRFGRTNLDLSVITLGGMRYVHGWDQPRDQVAEDTLAECRTMVRLALKAGVNLIETAHGYGKSEHCYGHVLDELKVPRHHYRLMTKGAPMTADETKRMVEEQLKALRTDHIDLYGWHGINTPELLQAAIAQGGPVEALHRLRDQGVIGHVGFSSHARLGTIIDAIASGLFSFVNLHYYYFYQRLAGAVAYAAEKGLGVFIISPNDKGGQLFHPSPLLSELCAPLTPIQFNARWCLKTPQVHTLSFGMTKPEHVAEMLGVFPTRVPLSAQDLAIQLRLDARAAVDPDAQWEGWECQDDPSGINIPEVLRFRRLGRCFDLHGFGRYRYNMLQSKGHWFPGGFADPTAVAAVQTAQAPPHLDLKAMLSETHAAYVHRS